MTTRNSEKKEIVLEIPEGEIDVIHILQLMWINRASLIASILTTVIITAIYSYTLIDVYRAEALLVPAENTQPNNPLLAQLGVAAGLVGIDANSREANQTAKAIATLQSRRFLNNFIDTHNLYDSLTGSLVESAEAVDGNKNSDALPVLSSILDVSQSRENQLITVGIEWHSPGEARDWVNWLIQDVNNLVKQQDLEEATNSIEYLQSQLESTQLVEMQRAFYQLIEAQTRIVMLADVREEYVFEVVDPAFLPENKVRPNRFFMIIVAVIAGAVIGMGFILFRNALGYFNK